MPPTATSPTAPRTFPWGVCVGALAAMESEAASHALLPTAPGGLLVRFDLASQPAAVQVLETAALSLVDALPHRALEVHVIDFAIRKRFQYLSGLAPLRQYRLYDNRREAGGALDDFEALARYRHHELLTGDTPTLSDYNRDSRGFERYRLLILNLNDFPGDDQRERERLLNILDAAFDAGIYLLAFVNTETLAPPPPDRKDPPPAFWTLLANRYPQVRIIKGGDAAAPLEILPGAHSQPLLDAMFEQGLSLAPPRADLAALLERRKTLAASDADQSRDFLSVPVGRTPDGRSEVLFSLGARSDCNNAFMVGMAGSGKTTLLNNLIVGIAERYTSDELRLYLMDYKDGVEFQVFADHPNCEKIFLDNKDLDAATRLLESFVGAIDDRAALFRRLSVKDIDAYNALGEPRLPRLLLIVDEVQRLFTEDAKGRHFNDLLKDVVKRGRAFGVHIVLSTQTLINANIDRDTMSQIALRIAFKLNNDSDCDKIFNYGNQSPRNLEKYEFIYNPDSGHKEANLRSRALPPPEIATRLAEVRANRAPHLCMNPEIVLSIRDEIVGEKQELRTQEGQNLSIRSKFPEKRNVSQRLEDELRQKRAERCVDANQSNVTAGDDQAAAC